MASVQRFAAPFVLISTALTVAACGGGGGGGGSSAAPATPLPTSTPTCTSVARTAGTRRAPRSAGSVVPDRLVVSYRASGGRSAQDFQRAVASKSAFTIGSYGGVVQQSLSLPAGSDLAKAASMLRAMSGVTDVEPVHYRSLAADAEANDTDLTTSDQWYTYITSVDVNPSTNLGAWQLSKGSTSIKVAVIDTGIDQTNADLSAHLVKAESIVNGVVSTGAQDTNGHGTNVAGLATAAANNGYGFAGTGYAVSLLAYKVFPDATALCDTQSAGSDDEAAAINDAVASGANVINLSLGSANYNGAGVDTTEENAVENAIASGVTVVAANGNEYADSPATDGSGPDTPAAYPGVVAVGASANTHTTANAYASITSETVASYSNSGPTLLAPGGDPPAADNGDDRLNWIEGYDTLTAAYKLDQCTDSNGVCGALFAGTSQATPQVTGTIALMMAYHGGKIAPATVKSILSANSDFLSGISAARQGSGRLNAYKAVAAAK